jgi:hypothetical protein
MKREGLILHRNIHRHLQDHFLAGAASAGFLSSFLAGAALASLLVSALAADALGAGAATAGLASSFFAGAAGAWAKAVAANIVAIKVAINFMIKFPFRLCRNLYPYIYITR